MNAVFNVVYSFAFWIKVVILITSISIVVLWGPYGFQPLDQRWLEAAFSFGAPSAVVIMSAMILMFIFDDKPTSTMVAITNEIMILGFSVVTILEVVDVSAKGRESDGFVEGIVMAVLHAFCGLICQLDIYITYRNDVRNCGSKPFQNRPFIIKRTCRRTARTPNT